GSGAEMAVGALAGLVAAATGRVTVDGKAVRLGSVPHSVARDMLFVTDDRAAEGVFAHMTALDNLVAARLDAASRLGFLSWPALRRMGTRLAQRVGLDQRRLRSRAITLSGGNQQKLLFGRTIAGAGAGGLFIN